MSKPFSDSPPPSTDLLQKYRDGTLSAEEAQRLEEWRAHDPLVADALDGTAVATDGRAFAEGVAEVQSRLRRRLRPRRSTTVYWFRVAASFAFLLSVGYLVYYYVLLPKPIPSEPEATASARSAPVKRVAPTVPSASETSEFPSALALIPVEEEPVPLPSPVRTSSSAKKSTVSRSLPNSLAPVKSNAPSPLAEVAPVDKVNRKSAQEPSTRARTRTAATRMVNNALPMMSGRVVDQDSQEPLPGANVVVKGTTTRVVTDIDGRFALPLTKKNPSVVASSVGYTSEETLVGPSDSILITLAPDITSLSEVVVVGHDQVEETPPPAATAARPMGGIRAFKAYVQDALRYPPDGEAWRRVVKVTFTVQPDGSLTDFAVKKSAGAWYDREAIRVVRAGPDWQAATRAGTPVAKTVSVSVLFNK